MIDKTIHALRLALQAMPDNLELRKHLSDVLLKAGELEEAEKEYRLALAVTPDDASVKTGLADAFYRQGKTSVALVILDELVKDDTAPAHAFLLAARLYARSGARDLAAELYQKAVERDASLADVELVTLFDDHPDDASEQSDETSRTERMAVPVDELSDVPLMEVERPPITFQDVGGMERVKDDIRLRIIHPLQHPELYKAYGKSAGGGILMYGPPGCGKTHLARATAGEVNAYFIAVGIHDVLDMWIGNSEHNLHDLFELARANTPCVLFFDEVDALGASRTDMRQSGARHLINQFLSELDGINSSNTGVLVLAATNTPWHLDAAFRRPGRFDRILFVGPPDGEARAEIFRIHLKDKPLASIDYAKLVKKTDQFSGADITAVIDGAVEQKLREALVHGLPTPITTHNLLDAIKQVKPSTRDWFATARNHALYANQSGLYDDILTYLKL